MAQYRMKVSAGGQTEDDEGGYWEGFRMAMKGQYRWVHAPACWLTLLRSLHMDVRWHAFLIGSVSSLQGLLPFGKSHFLRRLNTGY